jgi:uncharacterized damage-inducible protein DinB
MSIADSIAAYEAGGTKLRKAAAGLTREQLLAFPVPGTWSIQQIILHLADSDLIASDRMKRIIAMDDPPLAVWDENGFVAKTHYHEMSAADAVDLFEINRRQTVRLLKLLPEATFARRGIHSEKGPVTLADMVASYARHLEHHLSFLLKKRALLGSPVTL